MANVNGGLVSKKPQESQPTTQQSIGVKNILANINMKKKFEEILGKKAAGFMASMINISNTALKDVEPYSIVSSGIIAATLDLPIDPNLGFAWIVPYNGKDASGNRIKKAQFQMGYKGFVQLALRTGQYKAINVIEIYKGQLKSWNPLTEELEFDFDSKENDEVMGYAAFFKLVNGFEKTVYWSKEDILKHAKRFSKTFNNGPWQSDFDGMAKKTVLKNTLSKWGILSIEMQTALTADQAVIKKEVAEGADISGNIEYVDSPSDNSNVIDAEYKDTKSEQQEDIYEGTPFQD
ncbi:recombinase RecT [Clostridium swellfunianum]|uniref:recombinase RecT n=1 Tax=Clostridium swellfunianum TaxID=1367462 RepID=UPI00202F1D3D|nr:recombinase RecT [Clostridium swellfunianum]MCM0648675.1 recombinase RecT [Clostridium swellfunianum]